MNELTLNDYLQKTHKLLRSQLSLIQLSLIQLSLIQLSLIQRLPSLTGYEKMVAATPYQSWYFVVRCDIMPHDK
nr:hypothetical protein [Moraxella osloensis]